MPRYFFDVAEGRKRIELVTEEFPDRQLARQYALGLVETMMRGKDEDDFSAVTIRDEQGNEIEVVKPEKR